MVFGGYQVEGGVTWVVFFFQARVQSKGTEPGTGLNYGDLERASGNHGDSWYLQGCLRGST